MCGICVADHTVISLLMPIGDATTARGSMYPAMMRWLMKRRFTTTSALALASS